MDQAHLDALGWTYIGIDITWTLALVCGMFFLFHHRHLPCIRMRRLPLLFVGVATLHLYGLFCFLKYVIGSLIPCAVEFWIMSLYLPFGFAMFHAANSQFLHIASRQRRFAHLDVLSDETLLGSETEKDNNTRWQRIAHKLKNADRIDWLMIYIGIGLVLQIFLTLLVFLGSEKFHSSWGLWDWAVKGTATEVGEECRRGWEWWLSIVWQFFWVWIYAPYMLWKSRNVYDVHGWRLQTICCCLVGLPATPLWLVALYAQSMKAVNKYWAPSCWFSASILLMEVVTIGFPIYEVFRTNRLRLETLEAITSRDSRLSGSTQFSSPFSTSSTKSEGRSDQSLSMKQLSLGQKLCQDRRRSDLFTMAGLENALRTNAVPLLQFAALKDFSGENVSFLMHLAEWRREWLRDSTAQHRRKQFLTGVSIYAHCVSPNFSKFPINISSKNSRELRSLFEKAACQILRRRSSAPKNSPTPFDYELEDAKAAGSTGSSISLNALGRENLEAVANITTLHTGEATKAVAIPENFKETVFDAAEREIKYLVLTNTWPRFVSDAYAISQSEEHKAARRSSWFRKSLM